MKKQIISLGLAASISSALFAATTYEIKKGWQLLGADQNITDLSIFNDTCVDYLWSYDTNATSDVPSWKLHIANGVDYNYCGETLDKLDQGDGFWAKASSDCNITIGSCETLSDIPTPENIEDDCVSCNSNVGKTITHNGFTYGTLVSSYTGRTWLDRNLGASQACTSTTDEACYGDYYQWGREADGHEKANSPTTSTLVTSISNVGNSFILSDDDWTIQDRDYKLRSENWSKTDGSSVCPVGFRVPTSSEIILEIKEEDTTMDNISLKFALSGARTNVSGNFDHIGAQGYIWTSSISGNIQPVMYWYTENAQARNDEIKAAHGFSVRCIKD